MILSREAQELLQSIDSESKQAVKKQNLFDNPVKVYLIIKTMFQNFKKTHQLELMQERVFEVKVKLNNDKHLPLTKVSAAAIFREHCLLDEDIILLIQMKEYLKPEIKTQLYSEVLTGISNLHNVGQVMKCYRSLLNLQFTNNNSAMYASIQQKMVNKLISMDLKGSDFKIIAKNILALPIIKQPIIILISQIYEKINQLKDFTLLYRIFQQNFTSRPQKVDLQALIKICLPETLQKIVQMVESGGQFASTVLQIAEAEAKNKLQRMELVMTTKTRAILNFIVQVVKFGRPIWHQIIQWQHQAAQQPKNFLKNSLQGILIDMLRDKRFFQTVLGIIEKITQIDQHSQIGLIFVRQLLNLENKQYLSHRIIRRFLAIKILKYNSSQQYLYQIFGKGLKFVEVILEMFNFDSNVVNFYHHIINNEQSMKLLQKYLKELSDKMPVKFKQFFKKCNSTNQGQILGNMNNPFLRILGEMIDIQTAINMVRDLGMVQPSKCLISLFGRLLVIFKDNKQLSTLKLGIVRSLNIILIRNSKQQLNSHFKVHLPAFIKENLIQESILIFQNVPLQINDELKRFYDIFLNKKKL